MLLPLSLSCGDKDATVHNGSYHFDSLYTFSGSVEAEEFRVVGDTDPLFFGIPADVKLDRHRNVYVVDHATSSLYMLSPKGGMLDTLATKGQGPGELQLPLKVTVSPDDTLYVVNPTDQRVSVFYPYSQNPFQYSFILAPDNGKHPSRVFSDKAGRMLATYSRPSSPRSDAPGFWVRRISREGIVLSDSLAFLSLTESHTTWSATGHVQTTHRPFGRQPFFSQDSEGRLCLAWSGAVRAECLDSEGNKNVWFDVSHSPRPVEPKDTRWYRQNLAPHDLHMVEKAGWHTSFPAFEYMTVDLLDRIWLRHPTSPDEIDAGATWTILDPASKTYSTTTLPGTLIVADATEDYVYAMHPYGETPTISIFALKGV